MKYFPQGAICLSLIDEDKPSYRAKTSSFNLHIHKQQIRLYFILPITTKNIIFYWISFHWINMNSSSLDKSCEKPLKSWQIVEQVTDKCLSSQGKMDWGEISSVWPRFDGLVVGSFYNSFLAKCWTWYITSNDDGKVPCLDLDLVKLIVWLV